LRHAAADHLGLAALGRAFIGGVAHAGIDDAVQLYAALLGECCQGCRCCQHRQCHALFHE